MAPPAPGSPAATLACAMRGELTAACGRLLARARDECGESEVGILLSGGVDTGATLAACAAARDADPALPRVACAVTVLVREEGAPLPPDAGFSEALAQRFGVERRAVGLTPAELVERAAGPVADALASFDPMQLRNAFVVHAALEAARAWGRTKFWLTGDQADELLGGYSFTWSDVPDAEWRAKRDRLVGRATYCADAIAERLGLATASAFRERGLVAWATTHAGRAECVGERVVYLDSTREGAQPRQTGKLVLRDAFPELVSAYRRKDPIEVGSGSTVLSREGFFAWPEGWPEPGARAATLAEGVVLRSPEHLRYYGVFKQTAAGRRFADALGAARRRENRDGPGVCADCLSPLRSEDETFCHTCGAWPAQARQRRAEPAT